MKHLIIIGAGGMGRTMYDMARESHGFGTEYDILGFIDDNTGALKNYTNYPAIIAPIQGYEPKDNEIYDFIIHRFHTLRFSSPVDVKEKKKVINPKRRIRLVKKQMKDAGVGTKSQMALQKQFEENKLQHRQEKKKLTHIKKQHQFELKKLKKKQKHKGH